MNKFACIDFVNNTILLPKEKLIKIKSLPVFLQPMIRGDIEGYNVFITKEKMELTDKFWYRLENELLKRDVAYAQIKGMKQCPFDDIIFITGEQIKRLLSKNIIEYIFRYNLVKVDAKYAKIGIITGSINETVEVMLPILESTTDLTLFSKVPSVYKEVRDEIYEKTRMRPKVFYPNRHLLSKMDIVFDLDGMGEYANYCKAKAIYIDIMNSIQRRKIKLNTLAPIIWYDFDIAFEGQQMEKDILEALLYENGLTKRALRNRINELEIKITRAYNSLRS